MTVRDNDVRRRLAQDLRDLATRRKDDPDGVFDQELLCVLGVGPGNSDDFADPEDVARLIALVEGGTCRNLSMRPADEFLCSSCGEHVDIAYMDKVDDYHARYCPNCGRMVTED